MYLYTDQPQFSRGLGENWQKFVYGGYHNAILSVKKLRQVK